MTCDAIGKALSDAIGQDDVAALALNKERGIAPISPRANDAGINVFIAVTCFEVRRPAPWEITQCRGDELTIRLA
jgi:hypothetical protein